MDDNGALFILGRSRDVIIRGGVNISPATIETSLESFRGITAHVVGIPDDSVGEVPFAVLLPSAAYTMPTETAMQDKVRRDRGLSHALAGFVTLEPLGLKALPMTPNGKVKKVDLKTIVMEYLGKHRSSDTDTSENTKGEVSSTFLSLWAKILAVEEKSLPLDVPISKISDSLTLARVRGLIRRTLGKDIDMVTLNHARGIRGLAKVVESLPTVGEAGYVASSTTPGPPSLADMVHTQGSQTIADRTQEVAAKSLDKYGLSWKNDVEAVFPIPDFARTFVGNVSNLRLGMVLRNISSVEVATVVEHSLKMWNVYRSVPIVVDNLHLLVQVRAGPASQKLCIIDREEPVPDVEAFKSFAAADDLSLVAMAPGPCFKATVVKIENGRNIGLITSLNHLVFDVTSLAMWVHDFHDALVKQSVNRARVSYKHFADLQYLNLNSSLARKSINFLVDRLEGVSSHNAGLWTFQDVCNAPGHTTNGLKAGSCPPPLHSATDSIYLRDLQNLQLKRGIPAVAVAKAALALLNVKHTKHPVALLMQVQAGRSWPFVTSPFVEANLPDPMTIAGCTLNVIPNPVCVDSQSTAGTFLSYIHKDLLEYSAHAHVPMTVVEERLGQVDRQTVNAAKAWQRFNWLGEIQGEAETDHPNIVMLDVQRRLPFKMLWNFGLDANERRTLRVRADYDATHLDLDRQVVSGLLNEMLQIAAWLAADDNWEKQISGCV